MRGPLVDRVKAWFLSHVATRLIKPPAISLTALTVAKAEVVQVPTRHGPVRCLITRPATAAPLAGASPPVHVNFHGGAFLIGAPHQDEHVVRLIAGEVGAVVVNVDYSRAPRVSFPHAHEECFDVLRWAAASGTDMGWDGGRITISGGSAGGNLALGVLEQVHRAGGPPVRAAVLVVPAVDVSAPVDTYVSDIPDPVVSPALVRTMQNAYFPDEAQRRDPLASPALAGEALAALPPLLVMTAQHDSLRSQQERFVSDARALGVNVTYRCFDGVDHDFNLSERTPQAVWNEFKSLVTSHLLTHLAVRPD